MGRAPGWTTLMTGRPPMQSPGRPPVNHREIKRRISALVADGMSSEDGAAACGVSMPLGSRSFRESGGMVPFPLTGSTGRYVSLEEREEMALLKAQNHGVREIARRLGRHPSTVSRELRRNAASRGGQLDYRASVAQWHAERRARRPKTAKLAANPTLRDYVQERLAG